MKRLISLLFSGILAVSPMISQENIFKKLGIPEGFVEYEKMGVMNNNFTTYDGDTFHFEDYTDMKTLVREIRRVNPLITNNIVNGEDYLMNVQALTEEIVEGITEDKYPSIFVFDFNGNFIYEKDEVLVDEKADGINGNEVWLRDFESQIKYPRL